SLLRASGNDETAGRLFWGIWKHYRRPEDTAGPAYARFNSLIGRYLLEYGFHLGSLRPPSSIGLVSRDAPFDRATMDNAFQYLARAVDGGRGAANVDLAACYALLGQCKTSIDVLERFIAAATKARHPIAFIDACIAGGVVWSMAGIWTS